ncbi:MULTISPECIES: CBU_0592 family membrane protein [Kitasatospora]|uniref:CBU-0592-like domain-containing protein n=1 Tax=Kitasatospora acidiphila TaxID=2567942 RepID=A0A540VZA8_9ACTN|nr:MULTISPECIES: hypothetical protein [Kitasatospora]MDH6139806.1 hypothetical protein [Kitasatospora sp. GP30]TQF02090.1 hypothetical protein E6W39_07085 [Kitasatospora acidiphila]
MEQAVQIFGSILILIPFALAQWGRISARSKPYLLLNLCGSAILAVLAALTSQWGFLLLEGVWAIVSAHSLVALVRGREPRATH